MLASERGLEEANARIASLQVNTEQNAKQLEQRMRYLLDGYEYMESVASQIPIGLQELVSKHREDLVLGVADETTESHKNAQILAAKSIDQLRKELRSISYDRSVLDIQTRNLISDTKYEYKQLSRELHEEEQAEAAALTAATNKSRMDAAKQQFSERNKKTPSTSVTRARSSSFSTRVERVNPNNLMVPSVRTGSLPPELRDLHTAPGDGINTNSSVTDLYSKSTAASAAKKKRLKSRSKSPSSAGSKSIDRVVESTGKLMNVMINSHQMQMKMRQQEQQGNAKSVAATAVAATDHELYTNLIGIMNTNSTRQQEQMLKAFQSIVEPLVTAQSAAAAATAAAAVAPVVHHTPIVRQYQQHGDGSGHCSPYRRDHNHGGHGHAHMHSSRGRDRDRDRRHSSSHSHGHGHGGRRSLSRGNIKEAEDLIAELGYKLLSSRSGRGISGSGDVSKLVKVPSGSDIASGVVAPEAATSEVENMNQSLVARNIQLMEPGADIRTGESSDVVITNMETSMMADAAVPDLISYSSRKIRPDEHHASLLLSPTEEKHAQYLAIQRHNEDIAERRRMQSHDARSQSVTKAESSGGGGELLLETPNQSVLLSPTPADATEQTPIGTAAAYVGRSTPPQVWCLANPSTTVKESRSTASATLVDATADAVDAAAADAIVDQCPSQTSVNVPSVATINSNSINNRTESSSASMHECFTKLITEVLANNREVAASNQQFFLQLLEQVKPSNSKVKRGGVGGSLNANDSGVYTSMGSVGDSMDSAAVCEETADALWTRPQEQEAAVDAETARQAEIIITEVVNDLLAAAVMSSEKKCDNQLLDAEVQVVTEPSSQPSAADIAIALVTAMKDMMISTTASASYGLSSSSDVVTNNPDTEAVAAEVAVAPAVDDVDNDSDEGSFIDVPSAYPIHNKAHSISTGGVGVGAGGWLSDLQQRRQMAAELDDLQPPHKTQIRHEPSHRHHHPRSRSRSRSRSKHSEQRPHPSSHGVGLMSRNVPSARAMRANLEVGIDSSLDSVRVAGDIAQSKTQSSRLKGYMRPTRSSSGSSVTGGFGSSLSSSSSGSLTSSVSSSVSGGLTPFGAHVPRMPNKLLRSAPNASSLAFKNSDMVKPNNNPGGSNINSSALQIIDSGDDSEKWDEDSNSSSSSDSAEHLMSVSTQSSSVASDAELNNINNLHSKGKRPVVTMDKRLHNLKIWGAANNSEGETMGPARALGLGRRLGSGTGTLGSGSGMSVSSSSDADHPHQHQLSDQSVSSSETSRSKRSTSAKRATTSVIGTSSGSGGGGRPLLVSNYVRNSATLKVQQQRKNL